MKKARHTIFLSWASLIAPLIPSTSNATLNMPQPNAPLRRRRRTATPPPVDLPALASALESLMIQDSSCILIPEAVRTFLITPQANGPLPVRAGLPPQAVSLLSYRLQPILVTGLDKLWTTRQLLIKDIGWDNVSRYAAYRLLTPQERIQSAPRRRRSNRQPVQPHPGEPLVHLPNPPPDQPDLQHPVRRRWYFPGDRPPTHLLPPPPVPLPDTGDG